MVVIPGASGRTSTGGRVVTRVADVRVDAGGYVKLRPQPPAF